MRDPFATAILCALGTGGAGWSVFFGGPESPSMALAILQWIMLVGCIVGLVTSLVQMANGR
jgi:hypothetical protein